MCSLYVYFASLLRPHAISNKVHFCTLVNDERVEVVDCVLPKDVAAKCRAPSPVCIDDNRSCMKHWKSGFFFIDRWAISDAMVWRHPNIAIDDPRPIDGSFNMAAPSGCTCYNFRNMPKGVSVLSRLSLVWKSHACDPVLRGADENGMGANPSKASLLLHSSPVTDVVSLDPTSEDLAVGTPSSKIVAKAEASKKQKASTSGATSSHVAKRTRSALTQSSGSATRPSLFLDDDDDDDDDDDACVEIPLVTPIRFVVVIPSSGTRVGASLLILLKDLTPEGKGVMVDDDAVPSAGVSRPRSSFRHALSFTDVFDDAIHMDFSLFPFLTKEVFIAPAVSKTIVDQFLTPREMIRVESFFDDQLTAKMSILHCMMMSHGGELLAFYRRLNHSHHEYVLSTDSRLKGYEEKSKAKGKERKKKIKSLTKSLDNLHTEVARLFAALNQATILEAKKDEEILRLKTTPLEFSVQGELLPLAASAGFERGLTMHQTKDESVVVLKKMINYVPGAQDRLAELRLTMPISTKFLRDARVSPPVAKESTATPALKSLVLSTNFYLTIVVVASKHDEEMVSAEVDGSDPKMTDDTITAKSGHAFVQSMSVVLDDFVELVSVGSGRVSFGPNDVVFALFVGEKSDGLTPFFVASVEAIVNPTRV
nr:hypothetical protein [Tanacetum cinerariifolium]